MDPDKTLEDLVNCIELGDRETARERAEELAVWLRRGGFMPRIAPHTLEFLLQVLADELRI